MRKRTATSIGMKRALMFAGGSALLAVSCSLTGHTYLALLTGVPAYLVLPGLMTQLAFRRNLTADLNSFLYSVGLSLLFWTLGGLVINTLLPLAGIDRPLSLTYIVPLYLLSVGILGGVAYWRGPRESFSPGSLRSNTWTHAAVALALLPPILSILGTTTLNNNGTGYVILVMLSCIFAYIMMLTLAYKAIDPKAYPIAIFGIGLALLLMYSMRSWHVIGWDIHDELRVFSKTMTMGRWRMAYYQGFAYNACLSITVLPTILARLFTLSPEYVFKLLYQIIFAVVPVGIYSLSRRFFLPVLAFLAACLFLVQNWFFELMPSLARQEIALVFFTLMLLVLMDSGLSRAHRLALLYTFGLGLIVSHYASAYIWLIMSASAYALLWGVRIFSDRARGARSFLPWSMLVFVGLGLFLWEVPITHTADNASTVTTKVGPQLARAFSPRVISDGLRTALGVRPSANTDRNVNRAYQTALSERPADASAYYPAASYASYQPRAEDDAKSARDYLPWPLAYAIRLLATLIKGLTYNIMSALGLAALAAYCVRRNYNAGLAFTAMCAVGYVCLVTMLLVPYLQETYNLPRLGLQVFVLLVIPAIYGLWLTVRRNAHFGMAIVALIVVTILALQVGVIDQFTGGPLRITLTQPRGRFDAYYIYDDEVFAAHWLGRERVDNTLVFTDSIAALRLQSYMDYQPSTQLFPPAILRRSYVYLDDANTMRNHSFYLFRNNLLSYNTPIDFLNQNMDLIYSGGGSRIYAGAVAGVR